MTEIIQIKSAQIHGLSLREVLIEGSKSRGLKQLHLSGLADNWLRESREKMSQVVQNLCAWSPVERLLIHLLPPEVAKSGAHLEAPIVLAAVALLHPDPLTREQIDFLTSHRFVGALSLDGSLVPTTVSAAIEAMDPQVIGPKKVASLAEMWNLVLNAGAWGESESRIITEQSSLPPPLACPLVEGRHWERLLLLAASLAEVPVLLLGSPGIGKSYLARWAASTKAPTQNPEQQKQIEQIWALAGLKVTHTNPLLTPQPRSHLSEFTGTISGSTSKPGYFSLAHLGTLLIDEFTEVSKDCREILRFILDEKSFMRSAKSGNVVWPANFWLIVTSNPCPCGYSVGEDLSRCRCSESARFAYRGRFSGPLWDRLGLKIFLSKKDAAISPVDEATCELLDAPPPLIHAKLETLRDTYLSKNQVLQKQIKLHAAFAGSSARNLSLKARLWSALATLAPQMHDDSAWGALLGMHQHAEESWKG